jgi:hypothetical protein
MANNLRDEVVVSTIRAGRCKDGKDHSGKVTILVPSEFPTSKAEVDKWREQIAPICARFGVKVDPLGWLLKGLYLAFQAKMNVMLASKWGKEEVATTAGSDKAAGAEEM